MELRRASYGWSGPVEPDQTVRFVVLGPVAVALWRIAGVVLLALLFMVLARASFGARPGLAQFKWWGSAAGAVLLALLAAGLPPAARSPADPRFGAPERAARFGSPRRPPCAPTCAEIMRAQVHLSDDRIQVELLASALAPLAVAVPYAGDRCGSMRWRWTALRRSPLRVSPVMRCGSR